MSNGQRGVILNIGEVLNEYLKQREFDLEKLDKISTDPTKIVDLIFYGTLQKDPATNEVKYSRGLLNIGDNPSQNPLSGDDTFSILDTFTMMMSPPIGYLIGVANERMKESDLYGAAIEISTIKDLSRPLSDFIYAFALTKMLSEEPKITKKEEQ